MEGDGAGPASPDIIGDGDKESGEGAAGEGGEDMVLLDGPGPGPELRLGLSELGEVAGIIGEGGFMVLEGGIAIGAGEGAWLEENATRAKDMASTSMARADAMIQKKMKDAGCRENKEERKKERE